MRILAVETSCDETSAAIVDAGRLVRSNVVASQIPLHQVYGGVVPEIASRQHVKVISTVAQRAIEDAGVSLADVEAVAATRGPGLSGSLLVGANFARGLALGLRVPYIPVNHLEGHIHSVWLGQSVPLPPEPELPMLALIVSGGHTELVLMRRHGEYEVIGRTLDDAAGEAFDKVARLLGLPYPGGPAIQSAAIDAVAPVRFPRARLLGTFDFSFSGLKTAVLHAVYEMVEGKTAHEIRGKALPRVDIAGGLSHEQVANVAAGFQDSVVDTLTSKTVQASRDFDVRSVAVVGGVAANRLLRQKMSQTIEVALHVSRIEFSTDNAAMIAAAAYYAPVASDQSDIQPGLELPSTATGQPFV